LIHEPKTISEHILKVYIHTCVRYIFHRSGGKLEVCLFTQKFCLYSEFILDLSISFLIYVDLVNRLHLLVQLPMDLLYYLLKVLKYVLYNAQNDKKMAPMASERPKTPSWAFLAPRLAKN
jgi:hypothetical protein